MWILLAAAIALRTGRGALAGATAVPSDSRRADPLGAVVVVVVVLVLPGEPVPPVCAIAGTAQKSEAANTSPANLNLSVFDRKPILLRRPTGLADGLPLKDSRLHLDRWIRPNCLVPPLPARPGGARDSAFGSRGSVAGSASM